MTSRITQDTYSLRIRELIALNPANQQEIAPGQIPLIGEKGKLGWYSSLEFLSSIYLDSVSSSALDILEAIQPGLSSLSTGLGTSISTLTSTFGGQLISSTAGFQRVASSFSTFLISTVAGLGTAGYRSSLDLNVSSFTADSVTLLQPYYSSILTSLYKANTIEYAKGLWVVGGQMNVGATASNGCLQWSSNARIWNAVSTPFTRVNKVLFTSTSSERWYATGYTNGTSNSTILISADGMGWSNTTDTHLIEGNAIAAGRFFDVGTSTDYWQVVVGGRTGLGTASDTIQATNDNGANWTSAAAATNLSNVKDAIYTSTNNGLFHFVGEQDSSTPYYPLINYVSGITNVASFTGYSLANFFTQFDRIDSLAADNSNNLICIGVSSSALYTGSNFGGAAGLNGFETGEQILPNGTENRIKYVSSLWVALGKGPMKTNPNGALGNWTTRNSYFDVARDIAYDASENLFVEVGKAFSPPSTIIKGSNITSLGDTVTTYFSTILTTSGSNLLIDGYGLLNDGQVTSSIIGLGTAGYLSTFMNDPDPQFSTVSSRAFILTEAIPSTITVPYVGQMFAAAYGNGVWLAGGSTITMGFPINLVKSIDNGATWTQNPSYFNQSRINRMHYQSGTTFFAADQSNIWKSTDNGDTWNTVGLANWDHTDFDLSIFTDRIAAVVSNNPNYIPFVDSNGNNPGSAAGLSNFNAGYAIAYNSTTNTWIAGGLGSNNGLSYTSTGNIQISVDNASNFTDGSCPIIGVYGLATNPSQNRWIAIGDRDGTATYTDIAYSTDSGSNWTVTSNIFTGCDPRRARVRWVNGRFFALGNSLLSGLTQQTIKTSANGVAWTAVSNNLLTAGDIAYGSNIYLAGGQQYASLPTPTDTYNNIIRSQSGFASWSNIFPDYKSTILSSIGGTIYVDGVPLLSLPVVTSTVIGLGDSGYLSTGSLTSTVEGLGTAGYLSSLDLVSTVEGLGTAGYISSVISSFSTLLTQTLFLIDPANTSISTPITLSTNSLMINTTSSIITSYDIASTVTGLATIGYISSTQVAPILTSTVIGLGTAGYLSTNDIQAPLLSTVEGLGTAGYLSAITYLADLTSSIDGLGSAGYLSTSAYTAELVSSIEGLGTAGYLSSGNLNASLESTVIGLGESGYVSSLTLTTTFVSTVEGLGTAGYISSLTFDSNLVSTVDGLGTAGYVSSLSLDSTLISTVEGLGTAGYVSTLTLDSTLISTVEGLGTAGYVSTNDYIAPLTSTIEGLGTALYISSTQLESTVIGLGTLGYLSTTTYFAPLISSLDGLGQAGYVSSLDLLSTVGGLASIGYLSTDSYQVLLGSSIIGLSESGYVSSTQLASTVEGLATAGYISTASYVPFLVSTVGGLSEAGYISTAHLTSTVETLGSLSYISSQQLLSSIDGLPSLGYVQTNAGTKFGIYQQYSPVGAFKQSFITTADQISFSPNFYSNLVAASRVSIDVNMNFFATFSSIATGSIDGTLQGFFGFAYSTVAQSTTVDFTSATGTIGIGKMRFVTDSNSLQNRPALFFVLSPRGSNTCSSITTTITDFLVTVNNTGF